MRHDTFMFLRRNRRTVDGQTYEYCTLVRTVRTTKGPRQEVFASLGKTPGLDQGSRHDWDNICDLLASMSQKTRCYRKWWANLIAKTTKSGDEHGQGGLTRCRPGFSRVRG